MRKLSLLLCIILPSLLLAQPLRQQNMKRWGVMPANYSGITHIENDLYAVVCDKAPIDGFYLMRITQDPTTGKVTNITPEGFKSRFSPSESAKSPQRDTEGKVKLLLSYAGRGVNGDTSRDEVDDPWYSGDFQATWEDVNEGCRGLLEHILRG